METTTDTMTEYQPARLNSIRCRPDCERAVVFLHGFSGDRDDTWNRLPCLLRNEIVDWDIYTLGYSTTLLPDLFGIWSADPDITTLAIRLSTEMSINPLDEYRSLALVAHSMGGLVAQRALVDDPALVERASNVILFGTPSAGLRKAVPVAFLKRQLRDMAMGSEFIDNLRLEWTVRFESNPNFELLVVAGEEDQFVPSESSLIPFPPRFRRVVPGNHLSMVRPADANSTTVRLLMSALSNATVTDDTADPLTLAAEVPNPAASRLIQARGDGMSYKEVVRSALALERNGNRDQAMALLQRYQALGTDVQGTLAGRIKRMWLESEDLSFAEHALTLYRGALDEALKADDVDQIYYHSINVAFLEFVAFDRIEQAEEMASLALQKAAAAIPNAWSVATQAEANLYLGRRDAAVKLYKRMLTFDAEFWQYSSTALQAGRIAGKLADIQLAETLEETFTDIV